MNRLKIITSNDLLACRACLTTDVRLYNIFEHELWGQFYKLSGCQVKIDDGYPQYLCSICAAQLQKYSSFRNMCRRARDMLHGIGISRVQLTTDYIRNMDLENHHALNLSKREIYKCNFMSQTEINESFDDAIYLNDDAFKGEHDDYKEVLHIDMNDDNDPETVRTDDESESVNVKFESSEYLYDSCDNDEKIFDSNDEDADDIVMKQEASSDNGLGDDAGNSKRIQSKKGIADDKDERPKKSKKGRIQDLIGTTKEFAEQNNFELRIFTREEQLEEIRALKEQASAKFHCDQCGMGFIYRSKFLNHYKCRHDPSNGDYVCEICNTRFHQKRYLYNHEIFVHLFQYICKTCGFVTRARGTAEAHAAFHAGKVYTCQCGRTFGHYSSYLSHKRLTHTSELNRCEYCGESFIGELGVRMHKRKIHGDVRESRLFGCDQCEAKFRTEEALGKHQSSYCGGHNCVNCGEVFSTENLLTYHLVQSHNHRNTSEELSECGTCKTRFHNNGALWRHLEDKCGQVVPCLQCGEGFNTEEEMNEHLNTHSTDEFKCEVCKKTYRSAHFFAEHYASCHSSTKDHVRIHRKPRKRTLRDSEGENTKRESTRTPRKVMCDVCGQLCLESIYPAHLKSHSGVEAYNCTMCPKRFTLPLALQSHMKTHTEERPYECGECKKRFKLRGAVKRHVMEVHFAVRPYQCHFCLKFFENKDSAQDHMKAVHVKTPASPRIKIRRQSSTD
ncbi:zinc finger protein 555-like isoform X2 [Galleria mellonella]|uniref:Zinc finger protein 555-like isoform X2 n=1 Tax=Galleria mellonella TaxID=7137 RepID=A0ABM3M9T8_GALME|nr:zinc finger protein 555-like isoform X2 [Galleria mellonella]